MHGCYMRLHIMISNLLHSLIHSLTERILFLLYIYFKAQGFCVMKNHHFIRHIFHYFRDTGEIMGEKEMRCFDYIHRYTPKNCYGNTSQINVLKMKTGCDVVSDLLDFVNVYIVFVVWFISHPLRITLNNVIS